MVQTASRDGDGHVDMPPRSLPEPDGGRQELSASGAQLSHLITADGINQGGYGTEDAPRGRLRTWFGDFLAGLVVMGPVAPTLAALVSVVLYSERGIAILDANSTLASSLVVAPLVLAISWLALALPCTFLGLTKADRTNSSSFSELLNRVQESQVWCQVASYTQRDDSDKSINQAVCKKLSYIQGQLNHHRGLCWVLGIHYITLWRKLHTAEALLAYVEPNHRLLARVAQIRARIADSKMSGTTRTNEELTSVVATLTDSGGQDQWNHAEERPTGGPANGTRMSDMQARAAVGQIQRSIDSLRTDNYAGLLAARNLLLGTSGVTGIFLYALLWLAIIARVDIQTIQAATAFYLVGALVGLFSLLYTQAGAGSAIDDYGLSRARLFVAPQLSGIAAVLGVVITAMVAATQASDVTLIQSFDMVKRQINVLVAAVFAFSPGLVLDRLKRQTEDYKEELRSSRNIPKRRPE